MERQDLLIEILSRLSVKDLCKFKCVSKEWYNLISDPIFRSTHHERAKRDPLMLFHRNYRRQRDYRKIPSLRLTTLDEKRRTIQNYFTTIIKDVKKMHCSVGVQAVTKVYPSGFDLVSVVNGTDDICICNPSTREFKKIVPAFKPSSHPFKAFAFGYLPSSNEYKMVHFFFHKKEEHKIQCEIFTVRDGGANSSSWRLWDGNYHYPHQGNLRVSSNICIDGMLYWLVSDQLHVCGIITFDMEREEFRTTNIPEPLSHLSTSDRIQPLIEVEGFLCLVHYVIPTTTMLHIWKLKDHKNHDWVMQFSIDFLNGLDGFTHIWQLKYPKVLGVINGEMLFESYGWLSCYNIKDKTFGRVRKLNIRYWHRPYLYIDSFFSLGTRTI